jgi:arylsulfatase
MPHVPLHASKAHRGKSEQGLYGDVIEEIDASVGAVVAALERTGNTERTLVLYASDNGPWLSYGNHAGSTGPLREGKGTTFEGGVRVPCIWRWPGQLPAGRVCDTPLMTIDILPTWAGRLGQALGEAPIDGVDVWAALRGDSALPERALFFYYRNNELQAMRRGRWKLHLPHSYRSMKGRAVGADGKPGQYDYGWKTGLELYDLEADVGESTDLSKTHASKVEELLVDVIAMRAELGDSLTGKPGPQRRPPGRIPTER